MAEGHRPTEGERTMSNLNQPKLPEGKTIALYQLASTGTYGQIDITNVYNTMIQETGDDHMSAGIVTSILTLTNEDRQAFYYGADTDCIDYLLEMASDHDEDFRELTSLKVTADGLRDSIRDLQYDNVGKDAIIADLEKRVDYLYSANKKLLDEQDCYVSTEEERRLRLTTEQKQAARKWLLDFGWIEENTGGGCMIMYKDFMCADGKVRMVGIDGESEDGCMYSVSLSTYWAMDGDYPETDNESTEENELLCQFQRDEIVSASGMYSDCY